MRTRALAIFRPQFPPQKSLIITPLKQQQSVCGVFAHTLCLRPQPRSAPCGNSFTAGHVGGLRRRRAAEGPAESDARWGSGLRISALWGTYWSGGACPPSPIPPCALRLPSAARRAKWPGGVVGRLLTPEDVEPALAWDRVGWLEVAREAWGAGRRVKQPAVTPGLYAGSWGCTHGIGEGTPVQPWTGQWHAGSWTPCFPAPILSHLRVTL